MSAADTMQDRVDLSHTNKAVAEIFGERRRQVSEEACAPLADDRYTSGELAQAAAAYAISSSTLSMALNEDAQKFAQLREQVLAAIVAEAGPVWPWDPKSFKPKDARRDLIRAGALIVAEIERIDRAALRVADCPRCEDEDPDCDVHAR